MFFRNQRDFDDSDYSLNHVLWQTRSVATGHTEDKLKEECVVCVWCSDQNVQNHVLERDSDGSHTDSKLSTVWPLEWRYRKKGVVILGTFFTSVRMVLLGPHWSKMQVECFCYASPKWPQKTKSRAYLLQQLHFVEYEWVKNNWVGRLQGRSISFRGNISFRPGFLACNRSVFE